MKRVYLCNISGAYQTVMPYSCGLLHAYCAADAGIAAAYDFQDYLFHLETDVPALAARIERPAVLGLSLLSWNARRSLKLARLVKARFPDCLIVAGGPEVPDEGLRFLRAHPEIDIAVHKEGEETFRLLLQQNLRPQPDWSAIDGISFRHGGEPVHVPRKRAFLNPIQTPSPYLLLFDGCIDYVDRKGIPRLNVWETSRGCPYSCTFCDWGSFVNQKLRQVGEERVLAEIEYITANFDEIHIADANFGILPRDLKFAELISRRISEGARLNSAHITYAKNLTENVMRVAELLETHRPSRAGFTFGIQSMDAGVLKNIKRINLHPEKIAQLKARLDARAIPSNVEMILGLPGETKTTFLNGVNFCIELGLTDLRAYQLMLLPNSEVNTPATLQEHQIESELVKIVEGESRDEDEFVNCVTATKDMPAQELWYLKRLVENIDLLHFGRWTYHLAMHLKRKLNLRPVDFYDRLLSYMIKNRSTVVARIVHGHFIDNWNSGSWNSFRGPHSPFDVDWGNCFFRKGTFHWLVVAELRQEFWREIEDFLRADGLWDQETADLLRYQDSLIIEFDYDPETGKTETFEYNWPEYFAGQELKARANTLHFHDQVIGRFNYPLKKRDPQAYFYVAGGYLFHFQKINAFEFSHMRLSYHQDAHVGRFEHAHIAAATVGGKT